MKGSTQRARRQRKARNAKLRAAQAPVVVITVPGVRQDCPGQRTGRINRQPGVSRAAREALARQMTEAR